MSSASEAVRSESAMAKFRAYLELGKLRLSALAVFAVLAGLYLGAVSDPPLRLAIAVSLGSLLVAAGGNALNMLSERHLDARMLRTRNRPLPSGRLRPRDVRRFGVTCTALGLTVLALEANLLAAALCALVFVTYVFVYTPLKRISTLNTLVGAVPGALPPVVGYAAGSGSLDLRAAILFLILFFWQVPHFLAIAWRYRDDYARSGMKMLSVADPEGRSITQQMLIYTMTLVVVSFLPYGVRMAGQAYLGAAICLNVLFVVPVLLAALFRWETAMRQTFLVSIIYLPLLLGFMVLDRVTAA